MHLLLCSVVAGVILVQPCTLYYISSEYCDGMVWYGVATFWPPTTYKACHTPVICMKWIWYEYEVDGRSQSYPTACPSEKPTQNPKTVPTPSRVMVWYGVVAL